MIKILKNLVTILLSKIDNIVITNNVFCEIRKFSIGMQVLSENQQLTKLNYHGNYSNRHKQQFFCKK
jgi:hypothetical protein